MPTNLDDVSGVYCLKFTTGNGSDSENNYMNTYQRLKDTSNILQLFFYLKTLQTFEFVSFSIITYFNPFYRLIEQL